MRGCLTCRLHARRFQSPLSRDRERDRGNKRYHGKCSTLDLCKWSQGVTLLDGKRSSCVKEGTTVDASAHCRSQTSLFLTSHSCVQVTTSSSNDYQRGPDSLQGKLGRWQRMAAGNLGFSTLEAGYSEFCGVPNPICRYHRPTHSHPSRLPFIKPPRLVTSCLPHLDRHHPSRCQTSQSMRLHA